MVLSRVSLHGIRLDMMPWQVYPSSKTGRDEYIIPSDIREITLSHQGVGDDTLYLISVKAEDVFDGQIYTYSCKTKADYLKTVLEFTRDYPPYLLLEGEKVLRNAASEFGIDKVVTDDDSNVNTFYLKDRDDDTYNKITWNIVGQGGTDKEEEKKYSWRYHRHNGEFFGDNSRTVAELQKAARQRNRITSAVLTVIEGRESEDISYVPPAEPVSVETRLYWTPSRNEKTGAAGFDIDFQETDRKRFWINRDTMKTYSQLTDDGLSYFDRLIIPESLREKIIQEHRSQGGGK